jgi:predicted alpha/beta superfamily hydrolase
LYPKALPSHELNAPGGGQKFLSFLTNKLLPIIDSEFRTNKENRSLLGHSFGGYFVLYSALNQIENKTRDIKTFISASPTLWYNDFYLNRITGAINKNNPDTLNLFLSVGALEDSTWAVKLVKVLTEKIENAKNKIIKLQSRIFNHLDHMDVAVLSFTKGLQEFTKKEKH